MKLQNALTVFSSCLVDGCFNLTQVRGSAVDSDRLILLSNCGSNVLRLLKRANDQPKSVFGKMNLYVKFNHRVWIDIGC